MKIYLARHGETDWNAQRRLQGWIDIPLNATGRQQAEELEAKLRNIELDAIYCSALQRAIETARILNRKPVISIKELNEQSLGKFEGLQLEDEALAEFQKRRLNPEDSLDGGESRSQHVSRVRPALDKIAHSHSENSQVLIIGHGGTNSVILRELFNLQTDLMFQIANNELFLIDLPLAGSPTLWKYCGIRGL
jgi:2,3-bisphosphoglycerate-dependent phosphoglycerate mutase